MNKDVSNYLLTLAGALSLVVIGWIFGNDYTLHSVHKDCQEFGGAKLYTGVVIECKVEVLK